MSKSTSASQGDGLIANFIKTLEQERETAGLPEEVLHLLSTPEGRPHIRAMIESLKAAQPVLSTMQHCRNVSADPISAQDVFDENNVWVSDRAKALVDWSKTTTPSNNLGWQNLDQSANDAKIHQELGERIMESGEIAALIGAQPGGVEGDLLTNSYANIFYAIGKNGEEVAVVVRWDAVDGQWHVLALPLDDDVWGAVYRVFSRN